MEVWGVFLRSEQQRLHLILNGLGDLRKVWNVSLGPGKQAVLLQTVRIAPTPRMWAVPGDTSGKLLADNRSRQLFRAP